MNVFEAVDVIMLIKGGHYADLELTVGEALLKRPPVRSSLHLGFIRPNADAGVSRYIHLLSRGWPRYHI